MSLNNNVWNSIGTVTSEKYIAIQLRHYIVLQNLLHEKQTKLSSNIQDSRYISMQ